MTILLRYCHLLFRSPGANSGGIHQLESRGMRLPVDNVDRQLEKVERGIVELLNELEINVLVIVPLSQDPVIAATSRAVVLGGAALELPLHRGDLPEVVQLGGRGGVGRGSLVAGKGGTG